MAQGPVSDHEGRPLGGQVDLSGEAEACAQKGGDGRDVAKVGFRDDTSTGGSPVEYESGDGSEKSAAETAPSIGDGADEEMDAGVVRSDRIVASQRIQICPVDLPVAHRSALQHP